MIHHRLNVWIVTILFPITYFVNDNMDYIEMFLDLDFFLNYKIRSHITLYVHDKSHICKLIWDPLREKLPPFKK
jgi:hypothetical protein